MDYAHSPESFYAPENFKSGEVSTFAASPNSLYMYDQELHDMQNTLNNSVFCGQVCGSGDTITLNAEGDFDLDPYYEKSDSLEGYFAQEANDPMVSDLSGELSTSTSVSPAQKLTSESMLTVLTPKTDDMEDGPTLAELNMNPILIEDVDSMIRHEEEEEKSNRQYMGERGVQQQACIRDILKSMITSTQPTRTVDAPTKGNTYLPLDRYTASQTSPSMSHSHNSPVSHLYGSATPTHTNNNVAVVPPILAVNIKTEPVDIDDKLCLHKLLTAPPKSAVSPPQTVPTSAGKQVMPVVGQKRPPPLQQVKSESVEEKWKEIEKFIHDPETSPHKKRRRHESGSSAVLSDDDDYQDMQGDYSDSDDSDAESDISDTPLDESLTELAKKSKQYFWQYNVQAKGPKGTRLKLSISNDDPHNPSNFEDPVFDINSTNLVGIRHGGKARKGDGNEVTPNPKKLCHIGQQLYKLNRQINSFSASSDQPASVRNKSRKEKNKLASRACRLKKKAQHEANKIKLKGLDCEQGELLEVVNQIWPVLKERVTQHLKGMRVLEGKGSLLERFNAIFASRRKLFIAGSTTEFVNDVIAKVEEGDPAGGLPIRVRK